MRRKLLPLLVLIASAPLQVPASGPNTAVSVAPSAIPFNEVAKLAQLQKDQFEGTTTFDKRKCASIARLLKADPSKAIVFPVAEGIRSHYDADRQQFVFESMSKAGSPDRPGAYYLTILSRETEKAGYVGQNAFGVSRQVTVQIGRAHV